MDNEEIKFIRGDGDLSDDPHYATLAVSILHQQRAGFKNTIDLRRFNCPVCNGPGYNTGFGWLMFACGNEVLSDGEQGDGECRAAIAAMEGR